MPSELNTDQEFCSHLPQSCPPNDALEPELKVYLLSANFPLTREDFKSVRERNPNKHPFPNPEKECKACGLSCFSDKSGAEFVKKLPKFKKHKVYEATLSPKIGKIKHTPSKNVPNCSHHTLWPYKNSKPWKEFVPLDKQDQ